MKRSYEAMDFNYTVSETRTIDLLETIHRIANIHLQDERNRWNSTGTIKGAFLHQLYDTLENKTDIDQEIQSLRVQGVVKCIDCSLYISDGLYIMLQQDYFQSFLPPDKNLGTIFENILKQDKYRSRMSFTRSELLGAPDISNSFHHSLDENVKSSSTLLSKSFGRDEPETLDHKSSDSVCISHNVKSDESHIKCKEYQLTSEEIDRLVSIRYLFHDMNSSDALWLCHPYIGMIARWLHDGNDEIIQMIKRKKYREMYASELVYHGHNTSKTKGSRKLKTSELHVSYHLHDMVGRGLLKRVIHSSGNKDKNLYRLASK